MVEKLVKMPFLIKEFCRYDTGRTTLANLANILQLSITIMKEIVVLSLFSVSLIFHVFWFILMREDDWMNEKFREKVVLKKMENDVKYREESREWKRAFEEGFEGID